MNEFWLGGIKVIEHASLSFNQAYSSKRVSTDHQMGDGGTIRQTLIGTENKLRTQINGWGWMPLNLAGLDYSQPMLLKCFDPRIVAGASETITLPAARRSDAGYTPIGYAMVGDEEILTTIDNITDDVATLVTMPGATSYHVQYVPEITVLATLTENYQSEPDRYYWTLD